MNETLKSGDVVTLKSGGPRMTIERVVQSQFTEEPSVDCVWFEGKERKSAAFALAAVERYEPKQAQTIAFR